VTSGAAIAFRHAIRQSIHHGVTGEAGLVAAFVLLALVGFALTGGVARGGSSLLTARTATEFTPTTVRFSFKAKATKPALVLSGAGRLMFPDAPAENVLEQAPTVRGTVIMRRGVSSATFTVTGARYVFSTRIGILFQEVGLAGQITKSTIRTCRVRSAGVITVETEENLPSSRRLFRVGSFADNGVVFRICGIRGADPGPVAKIVATADPGRQAKNLP
jgi:hypothetical protein